MLVTGGAGFVGHHVVATLRADGHEVVVADLEPSDITGDLLEPAVREAAVTPDLDGVVHLAAETSVLGSMERPAFVHRTNVDLTAALLELCRERGVGTFALASTNAVVGAVSGVITEDLPLAPLTPYGATKAAGEMLMAGYSGAYGLRTPALRFSNVYGPGMQHKDSFVPRLLKAAAAGSGVEIYGDGTQVRDLVHVRDIARAMTLAVTGWPSGPVIVGSGASYSVLDIADAARRASGREIPATHVPPKPGEMPAVVVDASLAASRGWTAQVDLDEGMREAWADFAP
ncbi:NAD-dependent epimerase/dehydratase family protein [Nocardioides mangrovicus]|uniref:NAD-dependent epimerase/dehydratase family protein n=1 Tax=Nocardioides mangrovicus TaxID=2478913 RepID=A0A3L8P209_9ACTN|nr:NAD-dependent epimerase/dehydratase family protein [Nocardioides mangrovicus]